MQVKPVKAAIVGCGSISEAYATCAAKYFSIVNIEKCCDLDQARMEAFSGKHGIATQSYEEILRDPSIEMILNLTNPNAHFAVSKQALLAGKHVYSEKMMTVTLEEGRELCALAAECGLRLGVAPDTFLGGSAQTSRYIIDHGLIGKPLSITASISRDFGVFGDLLPHLNREGAGIAFDMGCYFFATLFSIFGAVEKVSAFTKTNNPDRTNQRLTSAQWGQPVHVEVPNVVTAVLRFESGVLATFHLNADSLLEETSYVDVYGEEGILHMGAPNKYGSPVRLKKLGGEEIAFPFTHGYSDQARGIGAAEMAWSMRAGRPHRASMEMALHELEAMHAVLTAAREERVVSVDTRFERPNPLPAGYLDYGLWGPTPQSALC